MSGRSWWAGVGDGHRLGSRVHPALAVAAVVAVLGVVGLWYGHGAGYGAVSGVGGGAGVGQAADSAGASADASGGGAASGGGSEGSSAGGSATVGNITVRGGYLREPASPNVAAAYMSITNTGTSPDTLLSAYCGAARNTAVHDVTGSPAADRHIPSGPVTIAAGKTLTLSPGHGHLMLTGLTGALRPGDSVSMLLTFQRAGQVLVELPVVAIGAIAPDGSR